MSILFVEEASQVMALAASPTLKKLMIKEMSTS